MKFGNDAGLLRAFFFLLFRNLLLSHLAVPRCFPSSEVLDSRRLSR